MKFKQLWAQRRPHLWFQLYWVIYLIWFFWLQQLVCYHNLFCQVHYI